MTCVWHDADIRAGVGHSLRDEWSIACETCVCVGFHRKRPFLLRPLIRWCVLVCLRSLSLPPPAAELGASGPIKGLSTSLWVSDGPWAGRRLAAVCYALDSNGDPLPIGWDWAARALEFAPLAPLIRPLPHGPPARIPAIAEAEKHAKRTMEDVDIRTTQVDPHMNLDAKADARTLNLNLDTQADARPLNPSTQPIPGNSHLTSGALISDTSDRVRLERNTRSPAASSKGASKLNQMTPLTTVLHVERRGRGQERVPTRATSRWTSYCSDEWTAQGRGLAGCLGPLILQVE